MLKVEILNTKDTAYAKLGDYKSFKIQENQSLKQWCENHVNSTKKVDMEIINNIDTLNKKPKEDKKSDKDKISPKETKKSEEIIDSILKNDIEKAPVKEMAYFNEYF